MDLRKITQDELNEILRKHKMWLIGESGGELADLRGANLREADLRWADLRWTNLRGADLRWADLRGADLSRANLRGANLRGANLRGADLSRADLYGANLRGANLREANLFGADLSRADLRGAKLESTKGLPPIVCPEKGSFIAYKRLRDNRIATLEIPEDAKRSSATTNKCRCDKAKVLSITSLDGTQEFDSGVSKYDSEFIYKVGEEVKVSDFNPDRWAECATGIHFFMTRQEAGLYFCF